MGPYAHYYMWGTSSISNLITIIGLLIKYACLCIAIRAQSLRSFVYAFLTTIGMNIVSFLLGILPRALAVNEFYFKLHDLIGFKGNHTILGALTANDLGFLLVLLIIFTIISTVFEIWIPLLVFRKISKKRILLWTFIGCFLANAFGLFCLGAYKYLYGAFPFGMVGDYIYHVKVDY